MRVMVVGATGTIGTAVSRALEGAGHELVAVSRSGDGPHADLADRASLERLYETVGSVGAVVCTAGVAKFGRFEDMTDEDFRASMDNKLMGQVNLIRIGVGRVHEGGSFTLTSGGLSRNPAPGTAVVSMVGAAVEAFARGAALDLGGRHRVNVVSPGWVAESRVAQGLEPMPGIWAADLARYYLRSVEGAETGIVWDAEAPLPSEE